jgi:hypothetical protein
MNKFYPPKAELMARVASFQTILFQSHPFLAIHSRGFYENGTTLGFLCTCAKQYVDRGYVSKVLFVSESESLKNLAGSILLDSLVSLNKSYVQKQTSDSYDIRDSLNEMQDALVEWLLIGSADFCMTTTAVKSTFSQTAILRGSCKYIPFDKKAWMKQPYDCVDLENNKDSHFHIPMHVFEGAAKEVLVEGEDVAYQNNSYVDRSILACRGIYNLPLSDDQRYQWWSNITRHDVATTVECIHESSVDFIERYYFDKYWNR